MMSPGRFDRHARLMHRMADALGVDLGDELVAGRLDAPQLRDMVVSCSRCNAPGACGSFLSEAEQAGKADVAPGYCRNRETLHRLAALR
jgi:hypothetical protein